MTRRSFSREFNREAVYLVTQCGVSLAQAARDLDLHATVLRRWIREFDDSPASAFPGKGQMKPDNEEVRRLRREVAKLKVERDILKKAAAYFARDQL
jgi:transposase